MMGRKKGAGFYTVLVVLVCTLFLLAGCKHKRKVKTEMALKDEENRYLTIINGTESTINKVFVYAGKDEDIEIEDLRQENIDDHNISVKIPDAYKDEKAFTVTFYDVFDIKYSKTKKAAKKGNTTIKITEDDYVEREGDWKRFLDKKLNQ